MKHGVFFKTFTEWNIDDKRLNQRYVALEAYLIEHGEMKGLVRAPGPGDNHAQALGERKARSKTHGVRSGRLRQGRPAAGRPGVDRGARHAAGRDQAGSEVKPWTYGSSTRRDFGGQEAGRRRRGRPERQERDRMIRFANNSVTVVNRSRRRSCPSIWRRTGRRAIASTSNLRGRA